MYAYTSPQQHVILDLFYEKVAMFCANLKFLTSFNLAPEAHYSKHLYVLTN